MCGIAGFVDFAGHRDEEAAARLRRMTDSIRHRGPDAEGFFIDRCAALGHRRLSIVDIATGQQPMGVADGAVQIVFNGEIYNFHELRRELEGHGHDFATRSDTEVILHAYLQWGENCVERLNGMFAFAIWDARTRQLLFARDRVGKKPLYIHRRGSLVAFASELAALRAGGLCPDEVDPEALDCYFTLGYIPAPRTIYRGVRKLGAARCSVVRETGERERRYWRPGFGEVRDVSLEAATEEFEALLDEAVGCRLTSEVPLGAFLSGGLDSSLVVSSMARILARQVVTNAIGFDDPEFDELHAARLTADHLGTDHHEHVVRPKAAETLPLIARHFDEPLADSSAIPTWYVCEMARKSVTVALSGDGGDESFAGYTARYVPHAIESRVRDALPAALRTAMFAPAGRLWPKSARLPRALRLKTIFENLAVGDTEAYYRDLAWLRDDTRLAVYSGDFVQNLKGFTPREAVCPYYLESGAADAVGRAQYADTNIYLTDDVLVKVDRMSMAHSLEVRAPLLDYRIIDFAAALPTRLKLSRHLGKLPLRALAARRLPSALLTLPKRGFSIPAAKWLRHDLRGLAEGLIFDRGCRTLEMLDTSRLHVIWKEHLAGARDHSVFVWAVMMIALWEDAARRGVAAGPVATRA